MKTLKIFLSRNADFFESAIKICRDLALDTNILYIEDIKTDKIMDSITNNDIIYFLCNHSSINEIINDMLPKQCIILNSKFYLKNYRKNDIQLLLQKKHIKVPRILQYSELSKDNFPVFCKEKTHTGIVFQAYNTFTIDRFFENFNQSDFYIEKSILGKDIPLQEFKIYFIKDKVFGKDNGLPINDRIKRITSKINTTIPELDIFSADIIRTSHYDYVIDINPASGLFLSSKARQYFAHSLRQISCKK